MASKISCQCTFKTIPEPEILFRGPKASLKAKLEEGLIKGAPVIKFLLKIQKLCLHGIASAKNKFRYNK